MVSLKGKKAKRQKGKRGTNPKRAIIVFQSTKRDETGLNIKFRLATRQVLML